MKKKAILLLALMMSFGAVKAQYEEGDMTFQPRVGVSFSTLTDDDDAKMKVNLTYGVEMEYFVADRLSVGAGVHFTDQGAKYKDPTGDLTMNLYYTTVPIMANYYVLPGLAVKAGIQPAYRVKARVEQGGEKIDFDRAMEAIFNDDDFKMNKFDLAVPLGLSFEFKGVTLDARYHFGLLKLFSGIDNKVHNRVITLTLGYKL